MLRLIQIPMPAPMMREMTLVMRKVNTTLVVERPFPFSSLAHGGTGLLAGTQPWSFHCLGGAMLGLELQMNSDISSLGSLTVLMYTPLQERVRKKLDYLHGQIDKSEE